MSPSRILLSVAAFALPMAAAAQEAAPESDFATDLRVTITGTVSSFDWTDPHCQLMLKVPLPDGGEISWNLELAPPAELKARGWKPSSLKPGNRVELEINPSLDGTTSGYVLAARKEGKPIGKTVEG
ncbi:hypothetical protein GRI89_06140 [Altererythrobacter salegens]|uniref:Uncharacterized protein n=1 Tax=Croceibacterium salegens TaxID=1737568 RepID=A0A6I4SUJ8_9SPHN|nr:DUF6152 family protein [Croceibacterium salegens]MXO59118.1 hypothetical protein [Croceibacterium salegens]